MTRAELARAMASGGSPSVDQRRFREALGTFATGVTIVSVRCGDQVHGMTANGFMSVSLDPALVVVSLAKKSRMHELLLEAGRYGVSVLSSSQEHVSRHFAGQTAVAGGFTFLEIDEVPLIEGALTHVVADVKDAHPAGDHTLFIGEVQHFGHHGGEPLIFHSGAYRGLLRAGSDPTRSQEWDGELHSWTLRVVPTQ